MTTHAASALPCAALLAALPLQAQDIDPKRCLYITGASDTALTRTGTEPRDMSLWSTGASSVGIGGYSRVYRTRYKEFRAGPASAKPGELRVLHDFGTPPSFDGLVGAPFLLQSDFEISLAEKEVRFFRPRNCSGQFLGYWDKDAVVVPFESSWSERPNPQFTVLLNGKKLNASFGDIDLLLGADFLRAHRVLFAMSQRKLYISYIGGEPLGQRRGLEPWIQKEAEAGNSDAQACFARTAIADYHAALGEADKAKTMLAQRPECGPPPKAT